MKPEEQRDWLHGFVLPLVAGGDVRVHGVVGQRELDELVVAGPVFDRDEKAMRLGEARHAIVAELLLDAQEPELDGPSLTLAAAVQNLLFLSHPAAHGPTVRRSRLRDVALWTVQVVAALPAPDGARELAERHSMLHHLFQLGRDDVRVSFWAGRREFRGAEPPPRLLKWGTVRRVREERWRVGVVSEAVSDPQQRMIVQALLSASPLTDLLEPLRLDPAIELKPLARWLRASEVARAVADRWLTLGFAQVAPLINVALLALYHDKDAADEVRIWTRFVCHLHLLRWALFPPGSGAVVEAQALAAAQPNVKDFFGLFAAAQRLGLGRPGDVERDRRITESIDRWAATCVTICGPARVAELEALLARAAHLRRDREWREGTA